MEPSYMRYMVWSATWDLSDRDVPEGSLYGVPRSDLPVKRGRIVEAQKCAYGHWLRARNLRVQSQEEGTHDRAYRLMWRRYEKEALARLVALAVQWDRLGY